MVCLALQSVRLDTPWKTQGLDGRGALLSSPIQGTISYMTARMGLLLATAKKSPYASVPRKSKLQIICALHPYDRLTKPLLIYRALIVAVVETNHPFPDARCIA